MQEKAKEPEIRFAGFTGAWEQRKLGDAVQVCSGKDYKHLSEGDIPVYGTGGYMLSVNDALSYKDDAVGIGRKGTIDKPFILKAPFWTVDTLFYAIPKKSFSLDFIYAIFQKIDWESKDESTGVPSLSKFTIENCGIVTPGEKEQKSIGEFFNHIDTLLTLHQRKYEKLLNIKKSMLEKMFPKEGEVVPEIRFKGFTGAWEQRKLKELATFNPKAEIPDTFEYVDLESVSGSEMTYHRTENKRSAPSRAQRVAQKGDLFYQTVRPYQKNNYLFDKDEYNYVFSTGYAQLRPKVSGVFLLGLVQSDSFVKTVLNSCTGTSYPAINSNDLSLIEVRSPRIYEEQEKIGSFLAHLESLLTLHQRKLEMLKNVKQAFLEKMFV